MIARFSGKCRRCGKRIEVGNAITLSRGRAAHLVCPLKKEPVPSIIATTDRLPYADN